MMDDLRVRLFLTSDLFLAEDLVEGNYRGLSRKGLQWELSYCFADQLF